MAQQNNIPMLITWLKNEDKIIEHSKALKPYQHAAQWIPIAIGPFVNTNAALLAGAAKINHSELPPHTGENNVANFELILKICPNLKQALKALNSDSSLVKSFVDHITAANSARAEDTSSCRKATAEYILPSDHTDDDIVYKKSDRGWNNRYTARLLCPLKYREEFDEDHELFMGKVLNRTIKLKASYWPSFLYPDCVEYNGECINDGLFRGERMLQFLQNICTGPTSAHDGIRKASKPSKAELHGMDYVFGCCVAYAAVQAYFSLSAIEQWLSSPQEGCFNLSDFFTNCVDLFESNPTDPWVKDTLDFLTDELLSLKRKYKEKHKRNTASASSDELDEDETKAIYDQWEAQCLEHIASNTSSNGVQGKLASRATNTPLESSKSPPPHKQKHTESRASTQPAASSDLSEEDD